jgi:heavy metal sensor kinase
MMQSKLPIRWRLTIWYGLLMIAGFALLGLGLYIGLHTLLLDSYEEQLLTQTDLAISAVEGRSGALTLNPGARDTLSSDDRFVRLIDTAGTVVVDTSPSIGTIPIDMDAVEAALAGRSSIKLQQINGGTFGISTKPVLSGDTIVGAVQLGLSRDDVDETLRLLLIVLGVAAPLVVIAALTGGYVIAGRALAPVAAITNLAASISTNELQSRIDLDLPDDELGRLAQTFNAMLERIQEGFERQRRFTGDAAHELRTPLSMMRSEVDLALRQPRTVTEYQAALEGLDQDLGRVTSLVSSLLMLARADERKLTLDPAPFNLAETISALVDQYQGIATSNGIELRGATEPVTVVADEDQIIQVIVNFLDNALAHTPPGGRIEVGASPEGDQIRVWVRDSGSGIAPEHLSRVFDRFYRVDHGRTRESGGAGLGLSIARAIVEAHYGTISLLSEPGKGTIAQFVLPLIPKLS